MDSFLVIVSTAAETDLNEIKNWYEEQAKGLGVKFSEHLDITYSSISRNPFFCFLVEQGIRRAVVKKFPYSVYYTIKENTAFVLAIIHQSRKPRTWKRKH